MHIFWNEEALSEANAAARYYHQKQAGLGPRFIDAVDEATTRIAHRP